MNIHYRKTWVWVLGAMLAAGSPAYAQSACSAVFPPAPKGLATLIDKEIGAENFLNRKIDPGRFGLAKGHCPHFDDSFCKINKWGDAGKYHFPKVSGLYSVMIWDHGGVTMAVGRVLDQKYMLNDVVRAVNQQIGFPPESCRPSDGYIREYGYPYVGNCGAARFDLNGKKFGLYIDIHGIVEEEPGLNVTVINYRFEDRDSEFKSCLREEQEALTKKRMLDKAKQSGQTLKLD